MKLKDYIQKLNKIAEKYPNVNVIYSIDDEGNGFNTVNSLPTLGFYHKEYQEFTPEDCGEDGEEVKINAICIN